MSTIRHAVDVNVPVAAAYHHWTQWEDFPKFMDSVEHVRRLDASHVRWRARVGGRDLEWDSEITEDVPQRRIAWRSISGPHQRGAVEFEPLGPTTTRVRVEMEYEPQGTLESIGDAMGIPSRQVHADLEQFKQFVERHNNV